MIKLRRLRHRLMHRDILSYFHITGQLTLTTSAFFFFYPHWGKGSWFKSFRRSLTNQYISSVTGKVNATALALTTNQLIVSLAGNSVLLWCVMLHFNELLCFSPLLVFLLNAPALWKEFMSLHSLYCTVPPVSVSERADNS